MTAVRNGRCAGVQAQSRLEVSRITTGRIQLHAERISLSDIMERAAETVSPLIAQRRHELNVSLPPQAIWLLRVRDTGIGIAPELLPHIFELFTQAERSLDRSQGGLGIGLCLVQRLVQLHGGTVDVQSVPSEGSEFVVRLPLVQTSMSSLPSPAVETVEPPGTCCRVLIVDDNVDTARSLAMLLKTSGHDVRIAHDGPTALAASADCPPDVVLLDIGLPGLSGYEVATSMRQQPGMGRVILVAMTGYGQKADLQRSQEAGLDHHLVKPADFNTVQRILTGVVRSAAVAVE